MACVSNVYSPTFETGDISILTPLRSAGKPFQVAALLDNGVSTFDPSAHEVTVMASSHNGEAQHVSTLTALLARAGCEEEHLRCGTHEPYRSGVEKRPITNNCSGKHTAMLLACKANGYLIANYEESDHPVQQIVRAELSDIFQAALIPGFDGCGVPTFAVEVRELARAYARLAAADTGGLACIRESYLQEPFYIAGTDRIETHLIAKYAIVAKSGSDGVWAAAVPGRNLGVAVKVVSGSENVAAIVTITILERLGVLTIADDPEIDRLLEWKSTTWTAKDAGALEIQMNLTRS